jgi:thiosulfate/3-mercaptopyruvate sulfurtransferase
VIRTTEHSLVDTAWLAANLEDPGLRIVDARWRGDGSGRQLYLEGHIPGAVHLDWHLDLNRERSGLRDLLLPPEEFSRVISAAGIGGETRVVAYAETDYSGAARLWWALRYYGHEQVAVLDGGITRWLAEGRPMSQEIPAITPARFTPRPRPALLATVQEIEAALQDQGRRVALVDTRPPEQYAGLAVWTPPGSRYLPPGQDWIELDGRVFRAGHIPGAVSLPSSQNLDSSEWTFLDPQALRDRAQASGVRPEQRVITYCGVGISASLGLFALHLAGYPDLALYDASWEEWGSDPEKPVARDDPLSS